MKLTHITAGIALSFMLAPMTAQAGGNYYNCASNSGCELVKTKLITSSYTKTQYPIVLAHGLGGWSRLFKTVDYFHGIPKALIKGGSEVYATKVSAAHNSEFRGEQLLRQVKTITAITGKSKVNLIGHSQGGIDIRYVASTAPSYVASVTAISSPEQGSKTADWALNTIAGGTAEDGLNVGNLNLQSKIVMAIMKVIGVSNDIGSGASLSELQEQDGWEAANGLTAGYMANFNAKFPAAMPTSYCGYPSNSYVNGIPYYSFSGASQITNRADFIDYAMALTGKAFGDDPNDGLVSSCSSRLGYVIRDDYKMNHADSINQFLGLTAWNEANPVTLYRAQINRLKVQEGL